MLIYGTALGITWIVFVAVWFVSALGAKRTLKRGWTGLWWRLGLIVVVVLLVHFNVLKGNPYFAGVVSLPALATAGIVLAALGIALAVWARIYLGRNWGMPMSVKENPDLVTSGPYAYIRNPIYTGILIAMLGSALVDWWWAVLFVGSAVYFVIAVYGEEKIMLREFPNAYPAYKARTWRLIPFIY